MWGPSQKVSSGIAKWFDKRSGEVGVLETQWHSCAIAENSIQNIVEAEVFLLVSLKAIV